MNNPMISNQDFLNYVISPQFKVDIWTGTTPEEKAARQAFFKELFDYNMPWYGYDGKIPPAGQRQGVSPAVTFGFLDTNIRVLNNKLDAAAKAPAPAADTSALQALAEKVDALATKIDAIPSDVLEFNYRANTNLAGAIDAIAAKPSGTSLPASVDVEALVTRLKAELPAAIRADIAAKLTT